MCVSAGKILVLLGLGMTFAGLILMIESKTIRQNGKKFDSHVPTKPILYRIAWMLTIVGYLLQIIGVILA